MEHPQRSQQVHVRVLATWVSRWLLDEGGVGRWMHVPMSRWADGRGHGKMHRWGVLIGEVCEWIDREVGSRQVLTDG